MIIKYERQVNLPRKEGRGGGGEGVTSDGVRNVDLVFVDQRVELHHVQVRAFSVEAVGSIVARLRANKQTSHVQQQTKKPHFDNTNNLPL